MGNKPTKERRDTAGATASHSSDFSTMGEAALIRKDLWPRDCYRNPGACASGKEFCQLQDRESWSEHETTTRGRCVRYQQACESCQQSPPAMPGVNTDALLRQPNGAYRPRQTTCAPGLVCTGSDVPTLPATCVPARKVPQTAAVPSRARLLDRAQRMLRMGARTDPGAARKFTSATSHDQAAQGSSRADVQAFVTHMVNTLWPTALGAPPGDLREDSSDVPCCLSRDYTAGLTRMQKSRGGAEFRDPSNPSNNPAPCVYCSFDGAYNDENPSVWEVLHVLTFNLPRVVSDAQRDVLRAIAPFLREHLSCSLCRSHVNEHLIKPGTPTSYIGADWARHFWRAHNYVNEQSNVTRCGNQDCAWGPWSEAASRCAGVYEHPWYMPFAEAKRQWAL